MNIFSAEVYTAVSTEAWFAHCSLLLPNPVPVPTNYHISSSLPRIYQLKEWGRVCDSTSFFGTTRERRGYLMARNTRTSELYEVTAASTTLQCLCWPQSAVLCFTFIYHTKFMVHLLILSLLTWSIWWAPNNVSRWQMGFNSAFKGLSELI